MRARVWAAGSAGAALLAVGLVTATPAFAATKVPGLLHASDIPGKFVIAQPPLTFTSLNRSTMDATACTQTPKPEQHGTSDAVSLQFGRADTKPGAKTLLEVITSYGSASDAKASFTERARDATAAERCRSVGFVPPSQTAPVGARTVYAHQKFPKIGDGSFAERLAAESGREPNIAVTIWSGPNIVEITIFDGLTSKAIQGSGVNDLAVTAKRAVQRLRHPVIIPTPAPARALVVDPATSGCARQLLMSPSSTKKAVITFVNKTDQTLNIQWIDGNGATQPYGDVAPGGRHVQQTYVGHIWKVTDQTQQCARIATVTGPTSTVTISG